MSSKLKELILEINVKICYNVKKEYKIADTYD